MDLGPHRRSEPPRSETSICWSDFVMKTTFSVPGSRHAIRLMSASCVCSRIAPPVQYVVLKKESSVLEAGCTPNFRLFPTTGTCSGHAFWTCVRFRTSRTSRTCFGLSRFRLRTGSARSGSRSHGYPIIARTRSTELRRGSAASPYVLTIVSSCSADSGLTQPPAAAYAYCMTHAVLLSMYLSAPGLASCSSV
jgi:hypothetical protein